VFALLLPGLENAPSTRVREGQLNGKSPRLDIRLIHLELLDVLRVGIHRELESLPQWFTVMGKITCQSGKENNQRRTQRTITKGRVKAQVPDSQDTGSRG